MTYEQRPDTIEAWKIVAVRPPDPMNGQDLVIEDERAEGGHREVHISAQDLSRSGCNPNVGDYFGRTHAGATTVQARALFERKWRKVEKQDA
jgi:hypothetical protein